MLKENNTAVVCFQFNFGYKNWHKIYSKNSKICYILVWTSGFHNPFVHADYRPKRSFGQGNIFTPVCHSLHRGGVPAPNFFWGCLLQIFGGVPAPNFGGCLLQIFGGVPAPNLGGVSAPNFRGGCLLQIFWGGSSNFRNTVTVRPVRILLECILVLTCLWTSNGVLTKSLWCLVLVWLGMCRFKQRGLRDYLVCGLTL